ncbi:hypothetical protein GCM10027341_55930 [Spirosoma knui]
MTIELYAAPATAAEGAVDSPISNVVGTLPEQEPDFNQSDLLGSFDSKEEAIAFARQQLEADQQVVTDCQVVPFNVYTHVEWLTLTTADAGSKNYYLVTDEGY